jgi:hypothetical protein
VIVDGHGRVVAWKAARVEGKSVVTQEGLGEEARRLWFMSFAAAGASQWVLSPGIR